MGSETPATQQLTAYAAMAHPPLLKKALIERDWMTAANQKYPYRCLPLAMANQLGWDVINPMTFTVRWTGGPDKKDVIIETPTKKPHPLALSHFGVGTFTLSIGYVFRTSPDMNLLITGPTNYPLDGLQACSGYVETEWLPATSTMNWLCTRPGHTACFPVGAPFCRIIPYPRGLMESIEPEILDLADNPEIEQQYREWSARRDKFNKELNVPGSVAAEAKWQKDYFKGGGSLAEAGHWPDRRDIHQTKFGHKQFTIKRENKLFAAPRPQEDVRPIVIGQDTVVWVKAELPNQ